MFREPKDIALKLVIKSSYFLQKDLYQLLQIQFQTDPRKKSKKDEKHCRIST